MSQHGILVVVSGFFRCRKRNFNEGTVKPVRQLFPVDLSHHPFPQGKVSSMGENTFFVSREHFQQMISDNQLIEYAQYVNHYYGTPKDYVQQQLEKGKDVILEIEIQGALKVKKRFPDALLLFVTPPSAQELKRRLVGRGTETLEVINARLHRAAEEASGMEAYDYLLVNDEIDRCVRQMHSLIQLQHLRTGYHLDFLNQMRDELYHLDD